MYIEQPQKEFTKLLTKFTWFEEGSELLSHYHFLGTDPKDFLNVMGSDFNLSIEHKLYSEARPAVYYIAIKNGEFFVSWSGKKYKVLSIKISEDSGLARMALEHTNVHDVVFPSTFLGYTGKFDQSVFKKK